MLKSLVGETVFILGGGPSLNEEDLSLLKGKCIMGVNVAMFLPYVKIGILGDWLFYTKRIHAIKSLHIPVVSFDDGVKKDYPRSIYYEKRQSAGMVFDGKGIAWFMPGNNNVGNTGAAALNLAVGLGASKIILIGFDMKRKEGGEHWHKEYETEKGRVESYEPYTDFSARFKSFVPQLQSLGIKVYNTCMDSGLECFEKKGLKELI